MINLSLATLGDSETLKAILRDNPMSGWVNLTVEREPSYFDGINIFSDDYPIIAYKNYDAVGMYCASLYAMYLNGIEEAGGYLGGLRVLSKFRNKISVLRDGFSSIARIVPNSTEKKIWFTSIVSDNLVARRILEAGIRGLPKYDFLTEMIILGLPASRGIHHGMWKELEESKWDSFLEFYRAEASKYNLAPAINKNNIKNMELGKVYIYEDEDGISASIALLDQRKYKQIVAVGYKWPVSFLIPLYNFFAAFSGRVPLPCAGEALQQTWLALFCVSCRSENVSQKLIEDALSICNTPIASIGLQTGHKLLDCLAYLKPMKYLINIYRVSIGDVVEMDDRPIKPEAALL